MIIAVNFPIKAIGKKKPEKKKGKKIRASTGWLNLKKFGTLKKMPHT